VRIRIPKVRVTDHRPPGAGGKPPVERQGATTGGSLPTRPAMTGLDHLAANITAEQAKHDSWVAGLTPATMEAAYQDLLLPIDPEDFEKEWQYKQALQWQKHRKAALRRAGYMMANIKS